MDKSRMRPPGHVSWGQPELRLELVPRDNAMQLMLDAIEHALEAWVLSAHCAEAMQLARSLVGPLLLGPITLRVFGAARGWIWLQVFVPEEVPVGVVSISHDRETVVFGTVFSVVVDPGSAQEPLDG